MGSRGAAQVCEQFFFSIGSVSSSRPLRYVSSRTLLRQLIHSSSHRLFIDHKLRTWKRVCARFVHSRTQHRLRSSYCHTVAPVCTLGFVGRHKERTFRSAGEESPGSPTGGECEAQGGKRQTEPTQEITESWVRRECMGLIMVERLRASMSNPIHSARFTFSQTSW